MTGAVAVLFVVGLVAVVLGLAAATLLVVRRQQRAFAAANEVVPGVPTRAPASWAGSHDPEARLHRRLRDAVAGLRAGPTALDGSAIELRVEVEQEAVALDEALVAIAAAPAASRPAPLARVEQAVTALEEVVGDLAAASAADAAERVEAALARAGEHRALLAEARAELDALLAPPS